MKSNFYENFKGNIKNNYKKTLFIFLPIFVFLIILDLLTKHFANANIPLGAEKNFIPGFINFNNVHNDGGAWNIFSGNQIFLIVFTSIFLLAFIYFYLREIKNGVLFHISVSLVCVGCVGNLIDRISLGYVRDMIQFSFWKSFPVFNVADICVCIGIFLLVLYYLIVLIKSKKDKQDEK